jgi:hypothetical protein
MLTIPLEAKAHTVRAEKLGYEVPAERRVSIAKNISQNVVFKLTQQMSRLELRGAPAGIEVRVDNAVLGRTAGSLFAGSIQPGDHVVRFSAGARELTQRFEPGGTVTVDWMNIAIAAPPPPPPPVVTLPPPDPAERDWIPVSTSSDPKVIEDYLKAYPNSRHKPEADGRLDDAVWSHVNQNDPQSLRDYAERFRNGRRASDAAARIAELAWSRVDQSNEQQLRDFMGQFPESTHGAQAQNLIDQFEARKRDAENKQKQEQQAKQDALKLRQTQQAAIRMVSTQFNDAFRARDAKALKQIWPSATQLYLDSLASAKSISGFKLSLQNCTDPEITGQKATISCDQTQTAQGTTTSFRLALTLRAAGNAWVIDTLSRR